MPSTQRVVDSHVKLMAPELPAGIRSGGERMPLEYPHLYQIQAGDWRISYAVEHNRLAILVLEVLNPEGTSSKDPAREKLTKNMKIKLLDWPEASGNAQVPPEELSKKLKIKWLDMADEVEEAGSGAGHAESRIKLKGSSSAKPAAQTPAGKSRITLLDSGEAIVEDQPDGQDGAEAATQDDGRKVTPLDKPSQ